MPHLRNERHIGGSVRRSKQPKARIGLLWSQFGAYHLDRCEAAAARLGSRAEVLAVEVATGSRDYRWDPSGPLHGARKVTLFPGELYDDIGFWRRLGAQFRALRGCSHVFVGIGYNETDVLVLTLLLRLIGVSVYLMTESKFDDFPRHMARELGKNVLMRMYCGVVVGGRRQAEYMRLLGFRRHHIVPGYDAVNLARVRAQGGGVVAPAGIPFAERPLIFVGRFVAKKNLGFLLEAYARYRAIAGNSARRLVLIGGGEEEPHLRAQVDALGIAASVDFPGFLPPDQVAQALAGGLALMLPSTEEQWGLVVNEALALNLPVIVSESVGARDVLVRNHVNGFVVEAHSIEGWARAMMRLSGKFEDWAAMCAKSGELAWYGDAGRFADAVEQMVSPGEAGSAENIARFWDACYGKESQG